MIDAAKKFLDAPLHESDKTKMENQQELNAHLIGLLLDHQVKDAFPAILAAYRSHRVHRTFSPTLKEIVAELGIEETFVFIPEDDVPDTTSKAARKLAAIRSITHKIDALRKLDERDSTTTHPHDAGDEEWETYDSDFLDAPVFAKSLLDDHSYDKVGRNDPCPCGSGRKFKKCCIFKKTSP